MNKKAPSNHGPYAFVVETSHNPSTHLQHNPHLSSIFRALYTGRAWYVFAELTGAKGSETASQGLCLEIATIFSDDCIANWIYLFNFALFLCYWDYDE